VGEGAARIHALAQLTLVDGGLGVGEGAARIHALAQLTLVDGGLRPGQSERCAGVGRVITPVTGGKGALPLDRRVCGVDADRSAAGQDLAGGGEALDVVRVGVLHG
jgi:hypothetical protein